MKTIIDLILEAKRNSTLSDISVKTNDIAVLSPKQKVLLATLIKENDIATDVSYSNIAFIAYKNGKEQLDIKDLIVIKELVSDSVKRVIWLAHDIGNSSENIDSKVYKTNRTINCFIKEIDNKIKASINNKTVMFNIPINIDGKVNRKALYAKLNDLKNKYTSINIIDVYDKAEVEGINADMHKVKFMPYAGYEDKEFSYEQYTKLFKDIKFFINGSEFDIINNKYYRSICYKHRWMFDEDTQDRLKATHNVAIFNSRHNCVNLVKEYNHKNILLCKLFGLDVSISESDEFESIIEYSFKNYELMINTLVLSEDFAYEISPFIDDNAIYYYILFYNLVYDAPNTECFGDNDYFEATAHISDEENDIEDITDNSDDEDMLDPEMEDRDED